MAGSGTPNGPQRAETHRPQSHLAGTRAGAEVFAHEMEAHGLADRLPDLLVEASRIAATVTHGIHGRRRAGPGETFWQFRQLQSTDDAQLIDWRRSASSDHLYVREREWEAAHTMWLWPDMSPSMAFRSHLSDVTKRARAIVLMLAAAELLVRGGERVGLLGLTQPTASRRAAVKLAEALAQRADDPVLVASLPPKARISRFSGVLLISDFLDPLDEIASRLEVLAGAGVRGHLVQVLDPAEETLPYDGRTEFIAPEGSLTWIADRAESLRDAYKARLEAHRAGLAAIAHRLGWTFLVHHTDRPASEPLLALIMHMSAGGYRWQQPSPAKGATA
ncbi:MAG: DUF58 domain-containing protein [Hyphomicrobiaceae bacterium]|nr:DUF58 domain-containing protein [Hyphomicrobiaceae bacterium]